MKEIENDSNLKINIIYEEKQKQEEILVNNSIDLNIIIEMAMEKFNIPSNNKDSLFFYYFDEDGDMNQLENEDNIFELSNHIKDNNLNVLNLYLSHFDAKSSYNLLSSKKLSKEIIDNIQINTIEDINQNEINNKEKDIKDKNENKKQKDINKDITKSIKNIIKNDDKNVVNNKYLKINQENKKEEEDQNNNNINVNYNINNINISDNINEINNNNEELQNSLLEKTKKNEELKKNIEEMKKIRIKDLQRQISEIKNKKEQKRKLIQEQKILELKIKNNEEIEKLNKIKADLLLNKYISNLQKNITEKIKPIIEEKISNIFIDKNKKLDNFIEKEKKNIFDDIKNNIENKKAEIINYNIKEVSNKNEKINNNLKKINEEINIIIKKLDNNFIPYHGNNQMHNLNIKTYTNGKKEIRISSFNQSQKNDNKAFNQSNNRQIDNDNTNDNGVAAIKNKFNLLLKEIYFDNLNDIWEKKKMKLIKFVLNITNMDYHLY